MHQVGLQTENGQERRRRRRRNTCLWLLQVRASLHWCMESTLLLCLFFLPSRQLPASTVNVCSHLSYMRVKYETQQLTSLLGHSLCRPRHSYFHTSCGLCPRPSFHPDSVTYSQPCLSIARLSSCLSNKLDLMVCSVKMSSISLKQVWMFWLPIKHCQVCYKDTSGLKINQKGKVSDGKSCSRLQRKM